MKAVLNIAKYPLAGLVVFGIALAVMLIMQPAPAAQPDAPNPAEAAPPAEKDAKPLPTVSNMRYFSSEELSGMLKEARSLKEKTQEEADRIAKRENRIAIMVKDLEKSKLALEGVRQDIDARRQELKQAEVDLQKRILEVKAVEAAGLARSAGIHAAMDPKAAAAAIAELQSEQAAKLLAFIEEKKAARILQEMKPEIASELLSLVERVKVDAELVK